LYQTKKKLKNFLKLKELPVFGAKKDKKNLQAMIFGLLIRFALQ
jgi:hypothetical protein